MEPNDAAALGIGFDTHNPKTDDIFSADGNIYGRPEREISLHWRGREIANLFCPVEIKTPKPQRFRVAVEHTFGGGLVTVQVDKAKVFDRFFVEGLAPEPGSWTLGGEIETKGRTLAPKSSGRAPRTDPPVMIKALDRVLNDASHHSASVAVDFTGAPAHSGRIVGRFKLEATPAGIDRWDRVGQLFITTAAGKRFEILRYITPYRKAWEWTIDLTDFAPLFRGKATVEMHCGTYGEGWLTSFDLAFYPGRQKEEAVEILPLWVGEPAVGLKSQPSSAFFVPRTVDLPASTSRVVVRTVVTGHGQAPNAKNAAEFYPLWRTITAGLVSERNRLWKEDVYLNPCRPQGGTWKFDRAGWAPGSVVEPWRVDVTRGWKRGTPLEIRYEVEPFENTTPDMGNLARHLFDGVLVRYERVR